MRPKFMQFEPRSSFGWSILSVSGILLIALGILHVPIWLLDGGSWEGSVSWRKPILFGVSTGMTLCSLGWLMGKLTPVKLDKLMAWLVSVSLVIEVALITVQKWRGVASHFNQETPLDRWIDTLMLGLIVIAFAGITYFWIRCFDKLELAPDYSLALRSGMCFLVVSCLIGFAISTYGYNRIAENLTPETIGERGVAKFPHGIAIHALQFLPLAVWILRWLRISEEQCTWAIRWLVVSFSIQIAFACHQTLNGLARTEFAATSGVILAVASVMTGMVPIAWPVLNRMIADRERSGKETGTKNK